MVVGATVAQPKLEHGPGQLGNKICGKIETGALRQEPPNRAVQPAHRRLRRTSGAGFDTRFLELADGVLQLLIGTLEASRQFTHHLDGHLRELHDQLEEYVLGSKMIPTRVPT